MSSLRMPAVTLCETLLVLASLFAVQSSGAADVGGLPHNEIRIRSDSDFDNALHPDNGVVGGSGTSSDPYMIEGWTIGPGSGGAGIEIWDTRVDFVIRNVHIQSLGIGIMLNNVTDGRIEDCHIENTSVGLNVLYSNDIKATDNNFSMNNYALSITYSDFKEWDNTFYENTNKIIERQWPWTLSQTGTLVCIGILIPLVAIVAILLYFNISARRRRKREAPPPP